AYVAENSRGLKTGTMSPLHMHLRGHCDGRTLQAFPSLVGDARSRGGPSRTRYGTAIAVRMARCLQDPIEQVWVIGRGGETALAGLPGIEPTRIISQPHAHDVQRFRDDLARMIQHISS